MTANMTDIERAAGITIAWLSNPGNRATVEDVSVVLRSTYGSLSRLVNVAVGGDPTSATRHAPAVSIRKSLESRDHIISLLDGKPYKMLRTHLRNNGLTPEEYRARFNLQRDYPMVSTSYSKARRAIAMKIGLGRREGTRSKMSTEPGE